MPNISQKSRAQGPGATTSLSHDTVPCEVSTDLMLEEPLSVFRPFTSTPEMMRTPRSSTFLANPYIDLVLLE